MSLESDLFSYVTADVGVAALIGARMYPGIIPQGGAQPCLVYNKQGRSRQQLTCGTDGLLMTRLDIDCYAVTYLQSVSLANAVTTALQDFSGIMGVTAIPRVFLTNEIDLSDIEPGLYRQTQSWVIWHRSV